ncbi:hypothetical protein PRIPAC_89280 [Pristionchus pacificus]|uniref:Uncharacterized protein n=1 Tax=Pristionchus pacificus TaxID=54126 RepID=A0A2A6B887_PRIPA|nr:hypothetical protein PRIPAC_89280 [Pristionchus pacificus]|eukprot:PDM62073.1 hypothetical protein PRIPAC_51515 [Pristionchus pacificus]
MWKLNYGNPMDRKDHRLSPHVRLYAYDLNLDVSVMSVVRSNRKNDQKENKKKAGEKKEEKEEQAC